MPQERWNPYSYPFATDEFNDMLWSRSFRDADDGIGLMGGHKHDFTALSHDVRVPGWLRGVKQWEKENPGRMESLRKILEPGCGAGGMTIHIYNYFREHVFPNGFPDDFSHLSLEIGHPLQNWHSQQILLEQYGFPLTQPPAFANHYRYQADTDFLEYADDPQNWQQFDCVLGLSLYDLLAEEQGRLDLFATTRRLLTKGGVFFLMATKPSVLGDNPEENGFKLMSPDRNRYDSIWEAV